MLRALMLLAVSTTACGRIGYTPIDAESDASLATSFCARPTTLAGQLDEDFAVGGIARFSVGGEADLGKDLAIDAQGRIVVAIQSKALTNSYALIRLEADGQMDMSFGSAGVAVLDQPGNDHLRALVIDPQGRLLVSGYSALGTPGAEASVLRFTASGAPDDTFGVAGFASFDLTPGETAVATRLAMDPQGRILASARAISGPRRGFALRLLTDGTLDTQFAGNGSVELVEMGGAVSAGAALLLDGNQLLVAGPRSAPNTSISEVSLWRLTDQGSPDPNWGMEGVAQAGFEDAEVWAAHSRPGGVLMAGWTKSEGPDVASLVALNSVGQPDLGFAFGGVQDLVVGDSHTRQYQLQVDDADRIVTIGSSESGGEENVFVARYDAAGSMDLTFGSSGLVPFSLSTGAAGDESLRGLVVDDEGRLVVAGWAENASGITETVVMRLCP